MTFSKFKNILFLGLAAVLFVAAVVAANFSGDWTLNESKSNFGDTQFGRQGATSMKVTQAGADITIAKTGKSFDGESYNWEEKLAYNGKETETTIFNGAKRKASVKWADDKNSFTVTSKTVIDRDGNTFEISSTEVWKLSADGKTLTVEVNSTSSFGTATRTLVYDKK
jgi:hypothetical protein